MADLTQSFVLGVADAYRLDELVAARLEPALRRCLEAARAAWPGVRVRGSEFAEHVARVAPEAEDVVAELAHLNTSDLFLAVACLHGDVAALRAFEQTIMPAAKRAVARVDGEATFVEEVCSDLRVRLLTEDDGPPRIATYLGHGPLVHWVQVAAMRLAQSRKRRRHHERYTALDDLALSLGGADPELSPLAEQLRVPFSAAFGHALAALSPRDRNVLRLYLVDGISAEKIGAMYRVHRATVARWLASARRKVYVETSKRLAEELGTEETSFDSLMGHVLSGMDLSLATFLEG